jgi:hypothetical protein
VSQSATISFERHSESICGNGGEVAIYSEQIVSIVAYAAKTNTQSLVVVQKLYFCCKNQKKMKKLFLILSVLLTIPVFAAGNGLQTNYLYTAAGTPTSIKTLNGSSALLNISYLNIDSHGNTGQRRDDYKGLSDACTYDNLNRLSSNQAAVAYAANGNITGKAGTGAYTCDSSKPHAVSRLDNVPEGLMTDNAVEYLWQIRWEL